MTAKEFGKLKIGGHVAIISTGTEGVVHNINRGSGMVLVAFFSIGAHWQYKAPIEKAWFRYIELGKL